MKLSQPLTGLPEILGSTEHIGAAAPGATGAIFEPLHSLAKIIDLGFGFSGHRLISVS
jgi:hypothetical protein